MVDGQREPRKVLFSFFISTGRRKGQADARHKQAPERLGEIQPGCQEGPLAWSESQPVSVPWRRGSGRGAGGAGATSTQLRTPGYMDHGCMIKFHCSFASLGPSGRFGFETPFSFVSLSSSFLLLFYFYFIFILIFFCFTVVFSSAGEWRTSKQAAASKE